MNIIRGLWMIRAINARYDSSPFLDDVAQWEGKIPPNFRSSKDALPP
jgi:hypothetical protein